MVVGLPQLETKLNAIICGGLVFHNWRHFFLFAINHDKCSCLFLQRMPINWHSMKRRDPSQKSPTIILFLNSLLRAKRAQEMREK